MNRRLSTTYLMQRERDLVRSIERESHIPNEKFANFLRNSSTFLARFSKLQPFLASCIIISKKLKRNQNQRNFEFSCIRNLFMVYALDIS